MSLWNSPSPQGGKIRISLFCFLHHLIFFLTFLRIQFEKKLTHFTPLITISWKNQPHVIHHCRKHYFDIVCSFEASLHMPQIPTTTFVSPNSTSSTVKNAPKITKPPSISSSSSSITILFMAFSSNRWFYCLKFIGHIISMASNFNASKIFLLLILF